MHNCCNCDGNSRLLHAHKNVRTKIFAVDGSEIVTVSGSVDPISSVELLPQFCPSSASVLPQFCKTSASVLTAYANNIAVTALCTSGYTEEATASGPLKLAVLTFCSCLPHSLLGMLTTRSLPL